MGFGKNGTGVIIREQTSKALSTLAANTTILVDTNDLAIGEDFRMLKSEIAAHIEGLTAGEGSGLIFGICNGELSVAEIAEALTNDGPSDRNDRGPQESAERFVKVLSQLDLGQADTKGAFRNDTNGPIIVAKPQWTFSNPEGWNFFVHNDGPSALTTGATMRLLMTHFGVWVK